MAGAPAEYLILSMNANGDSGKGMRAERKKYIVRLLQKEDPLVVCVQEFLWKGIHSRGWGHLDVPDHFRYEGHNEAGFIFDTREVTYSRIDNKASVRNMYDNMVNRSDIGLDYFELSRLCVCKIKSKGAPNFEILCASWHGPQKVIREKKEKSLDSLLEFLLKLKVEENDIPLLLVGDFNLPAHVVRSRLPSNGSLVLHTPNDSSIDMLITSSELWEISGVNTLERNMEFDHSPLGVNLIMKPPPDLMNPMHNLQLPYPSPLPLRNP